jgi:hypothetical protein
MSSRQYFEQLQTSGTDFHNSGITETDFLDEKKMEIDILGLTDDSVSSDNSDSGESFHSDSDIENDDGRSIYESVAENFETNKNNNAEKETGVAPKVSHFTTDIFSSAPDEVIEKSLSTSQNREVLMLTDTESDEDREVTSPELEAEPKLRSILKTSELYVPHISHRHKHRRNKKAAIGQTEVIDLDSSTDSSDVSIVDGEYDSRKVTFDTIRRERERMENIMNSEIEAEIKELERTISKKNGILSSQWDEDSERIWGDGNALAPRKENRDIRQDNRGSIFASQVYSNPESELPQYASYMHLEPKTEEVRFNLFDLLKEFFVVMLLHLYLGIYNAMFNVITIDGIVSCLIFYMSSIGITKVNNFLDKIRLITIDRYIYYLMLFVGVHIVNYITWFQFPEMTRYLASFMICPSIMAQIYQYKPYAKIRQVLYDGYNNLVKRIVCKQLAKIINMFIDNVLNIDVRVIYTDLMAHYHEFDFVVINKFIVTFILAMIFNHVDKGSLSIPIMIYKTFYMKDADYNIRDDRQYLTAVIEDQKWEKFLDVYTLNRMIRMLIENDDKDADISKIIKAFLKRQFFRFNRVMFCWSMMSLTRSLLGGILSFMLFVQHSEQRFRYALNVLIFSGLSMVTDEKILTLFICELCFPILESKLIFDVTRDTYNSLKRGLFNVYENTRAESIFFSILLSILSFFGLNVVAMGVVICINLILMLRFRNSDLNIGKVRMIKVEKKVDDKPNMDSLLDITRDMRLSDIRNYLSMISGLTMIEQPPPLPKKEKPLTYSINKNSDILRYISFSIQNNLLYKTMISSAVVDKLDLYRMLAYYFSVLIFGYVSGFAVLHLLLLPIAIQNVVDIIWCP